MTSLEPREDGFVVDEIPDVAQLISYLRDANISLQDPVRHGGVVYLLTTSRDSEHQLIVGVRGEVGSLVWASSSEQYVPSSGLNDNYSDYFTATDVDYSQPPRSEVPIDLVYKVVEEFHRTRSRPVGIEWVSPPEPAETAGSIDDLLFG